MNYIFPQRTSGLQKKSRVYGGNLMIIREGVVGRLVKKGVGRIFYSE